MDVNGHAAIVTGAATGMGAATAEALSRGGERSIGVMRVAENAAPKQRGKPFEKGRSGNPKGKPPGARNKASLMLDHMLREDAAEVLTAVLEKAKAGDIQAARLLLDRLMPVRKGRAVNIDLPRIEKAEDLLTALSTTIEAMGRGELTPEETGMSIGTINALF
jgi:hypothetical protein|tara:strand:+ start:212 stop:700 length:489 start_codon:yes stop_codon:yes gene_type:complete